MLNNFELENIAQHYGFPLTVLMKDELVNRKPKSGNYIINLESSSQGNGTHWLPLFVHKNRGFNRDQSGIIRPKKALVFGKGRSNPG